MSCLKIYLIICAIFFSGCSHRSIPFKGAFRHDGVLEIQVSPDVKIVDITDADGSLVSSIPTFGSQSVEIRFQWLPQNNYKVFFDKKFTGNVSAPLYPPRYRIRIHAPVGQQTYEDYIAGTSGDRSDTTLIIPIHNEEKVDILFEVEKLSDSGKGLVYIDVKNISIDSVISLAPYSINDSATMSFEYDKRNWGMQATYSTSAFKTESGRIQAYISIDGKLYRYLFLFKLSTAIRDSIDIVKWMLPSDENGYSSLRHSPGTILMPNPLWNHLSAMLGVESNVIEFFKPFAYQTISIQNSGKAPIGCMLTGEIIDHITGKESQWFKAPDNQFTGGTDKIISFVTVPPGKREICVLPVYVNPNTPAGAFTSRITVQSLGSDRILSCVENPVKVIRGDLLFTLWTMGIGIISAGWFLMVLVFYRRIVRALGLRILVLLSLLGSLQFCLSFFGRIVSSVMYVFLGPFNCLVGGLLTEVLTYLLVTSILFLAPRVGTMTIAGIVSYIMGGILFGSFGLTDILFIGSGIAFREILLFIFGITRFKQQDNLPSIVPMMLALGIADAASTFTFITLNAVFYRLYFADWYIMLNVIVTGFLYTAIGVYIGRSLGCSLRKVHV